jgi:hypothetical protein
VLTPTQLDSLHLNPCSPCSLSNPEWPLACRTLHIYQQACQSVACAAFHDRVSIEPVHLASHCLLGLSPGINIMPRTRPTDR